MRARAGTLRSGRLPIPALLLAALTLALYAPVREHDFVNYDDPAYVTENERVRAGLAAASVRWALSSPHEGNWHPLTMLSHMADVEVFGLDAGGHHLTSVALHVANVLVLFALLVRLSALPWRSAFVAGLFAVHPLNVQSVAWISERKNVLSTLFWLLALLAYVGYMRRRGWPRYLLVTALFALGLASKPMVVMLPVTLLLLDFWEGRAEVVGGKSLGTVWGRLALEKVPMVALSAGCALVTLQAQAAVGARQTLESYPLGVRLGNATVAGAWYLAKAVWPSELSVFYPHPMGTLEPWRVAASALGLLAVFVVVVWKGIRLPYLLFGAAWLVATLLPVIGLVQVGSQAYADRYAYVPLVGAFVAVTWAGADAAARFGPRGRRAAAGAGAVVLALYAAAASHQLGHWKDSITLFEHAVAVDPENATARGNLGVALSMEGRVEEAVAHFRAAVEARPDSAESHLNLGNALAMTGRPEEARERYLDAIRLRPEDARAHFNLGKLLADSGRPEDALPHLREAIRLKPDHDRARTLLSTLERVSGAP